MIEEFDVGGASTGYSADAGGFDLEFAMVFGEDGDDFVCFSYVSSFDDDSFCFKVFHEQIVFILAEN